MKTQKGISTFFAILVVGIIAVIGFTILYSYQYIWTEEEVVPKTEIPEKETSVPDDWKTYRNEGYMIEFQYPDNWEVCSLEEVCLKRINLFK